MCVPGRGLGAGLLGGGFGFGLRGPGLGGVRLGAGGLGLGLPRLGVARQHVETLDQGREGHGGVDIALGHMHAEAVGDQHRADHQQEAQRQHDDGRILVDEVRQRVGGQQHAQHGEDDGDHHDRHVIGHADRGQDGVDREHQVQQDDLEDRRADVVDHDVLLVLLQKVVGRGRVDRVVDLLRRLPHQEQAAGDQDQVAPAEGGVEAFAGQAQVEDRRRQADDPADRRQQAQSHDQGQADADPARPLPVLGGQFVRQDGDEDQVVDPQHDLHDHQGDQGRPGGGVAENGAEAFEHWISYIRVKPLA
jgi:hypothetical protein